VELRGTFLIGGEEEVVGSAVCDLGVEASRGGEGRLHLDAGLFLELHGKLFCGLHEVGRNGDSQPFRRRSLEG